MANEIVTRDEQYESGLLPRPQPRGNFVSVPQAQPVQQFGGPLGAHQVAIDVQHPATQHVELRTSAVDRATGYQIMVMPISLVVAVLAVIVSLAFDNELFTFASLLIFWLTFAVVYVIGWAMTALATPEAVSWYGAKRQWDIVAKEQIERWDYYKWLSGRTPTIDARQTANGRLPSWAILLISLAWVVGGVVGFLYWLGW